ncbi:hypothetical protein [Peribacillus acanthi]|uniref:hypothetical protein n=1 Tax=Peribacillus acanthi TaxID=2171554 RepID=UPI000D3E06DA|nr:hypothetical protein [Peribacillus acanthi]
MKFFHWEIEVDVEETKKQYEKNWERCQCKDCHNFYKAFESLTATENQVFTDLGIKPSQCVHVSSFGETDKRLVLYHATYHFVGKIIKGKPVSTSEWKEDKVVKEGNLTFVITDELIFVPEGFSPPILQLDVSIELPWVLG